uniref:Uncharacterized protein n=1 Tax=Tanacetum cinerariifolium TaxID=118510 RepID=A0A699H3J9_TANCI|nr:hypothetical protein [Tanacetum cinerariifolium]
MDDDLFTYEVEIPGLSRISCDKKEGDDSNDGDLDVYEPRVCYDEDKVAKIFKIETDIFNFETPICKAFNEFNYVLKIEIDLLTSDILGFKTYDEFKNEWMDKWNKGIPWVPEEPWEPNDDHGIDNFDNDLERDNASYHAKKSKSNTKKIGANCLEILAKNLRFAKLEGLRHTFGSLNREILRYCSDNLYVISIKEDTAYLCLHFTRNHKELKSNTPYPEDSIRRIEDVLKIREDIDRDPYSKKPPMRRIDLNQYDVDATIYVPPAFSYNQLAIIELKKPDKTMLKLAEDQKVKPYWNGESNAEQKLKTILTYSEQVPPKSRNDMPFEISQSLH